MEMNTSMLSSPSPESRSAGKKKTQLEMLKRHFDAGGRLTVASALSQLGIYALSQRCGDLRREGYPVVSRTVETEGGARVSEYYRAIQGELPV